MTKLEFMTQLERALKKHGAADCEDIMEEYEQHFAFKLADGYSEEEIAAKLGAPEELAQQFAPAAQKKPNGFPMPVTARTPDRYRQSPNAASMCAKGGAFL